MPNGDPNVITDHYAGITHNREAIIKASLQGVVRTSLGNDDIPYQLYRDCADELAFVESKIADMSLDQEIVPFAWLTTAITPVAKCTPINGPGDLRPYIRHSYTVWYGGSSGG